MVREHWSMKLNYFHVLISYVYVYLHAILIKRNIVNIENRHHHHHNEVQHDDEYSMDLYIHMNIQNIHRDVRVESIDLNLLMMKVQTMENYQYLLILYSQFQMTKKI